MLCGRHAGMLRTAWLGQLAGCGVMHRLQSRRQARLLLLDKLCWGLLPRLTQSLRGLHRWLSAQVHPLQHQTAVFGLVGPLLQWCGGTWPLVVAGMPSVLIMRGCCCPG